MGAAAATGPGRGLSSRLAPGPTRRHQRIHVPRAHAAGNPRQDVGQILDRIDSAEPAAPEDGVRDCGALTPCIRSREEEIFASQSCAHVQAFDNPVVNRDHAVFEGTFELNAVVGQIAYLLSRRVHKWTRLEVFKREGRGPPLVREVNSRTSPHLRPSPWLGFC